MELKLFAVTYVSDFDEDRGHIETRIYPTMERAHDALMEYLEKTRGKDGITIEEEYSGESMTGYYSYAGTPEEPEPSMGFERAVITEL